MTTETFGCTEFEQTLERISDELQLTHFTQGVEEYRWVRQLKQGEHTYWLPLDASAAVEIRSSIHSNGVAASTGEDSIRLWLVQWNGNFASLRDSLPLGGKLSRYTTRVSGWQTRLSDLIGHLAVFRLLAGNCPRCAKPLGIYKVKKAGANHGRLFAKCANTGYDAFKWIDA